MLNKPLVKLAIVGSRNITNKEIIYKLCDHAESIFGEPDIIISGGARGVDSIAQQYYEEKFKDLLNVDGEDLYAEKDIKIFLPDWSIGKYAGYERNKYIVKEATHCLAIWDGESKGTLNTIFLCKKFKTPIIIATVKNNELINTEIINETKTTD
jgi:predicted Rossmann fold nucleotide-binding protein DprA/Smf involved in DNA uptake